MHPRTLIPNIGHLKEVSIQSRFFNGLLEQRLMRPRRTRCNHHPVKVQLVDLFTNNLQPVRRTCIQKIGRKRHPVKTLSIFGNSLAIDDPADIRPAVTNENAYPFLQALGILFGRVFFRFDFAASGICKKFHCAARRTARLHYTFGNILRPVKTTGKENAVLGRFYQGKIAAFGKAILIKFESADLLKILGSL